MSAAARSAASPPGGGTFQPWGSPRKNCTQSAPRAVPWPSGSSPQMDPDLHLHDFSTLAREADGPVGGCPFVPVAPDEPRSRRMRNRVTVVALVTALLLGLALLSAP